METKTQSMELPTVRCALLIDDVCCAVRRAKGHNAGLWQFTGGKTLLDANFQPVESDVDAVIRETVEEAGFTPYYLNPLGVVHERHIPDGKWAGFNLVTRAFWTDVFTGEPRLDEESNALAWFKIDYILDNPSEFTPETPHIAARLPLSLAVSA